MDDRRPLWLFLFCTLLGSGCASSPAQSLGLLPDNHPLLESAKRSRYVPDEAPKELNKTVLPSYVVEPGDGLLILPVDLDSTVRLPTDQTVLPDGTIDLGKYGKLQVAGKTLEEIETLVGMAVKKITADAGFIDVRLVNRQSKVFYVLGEVNTPGKFNLTGNETVLDGLLTAGGLSDKGSRHHIILARPTPDGCSSIFAVHYYAIVQLGETRTNYQLQPGDRIYVPTRGLFESIQDHINCNVKP